MLKISIIIALHAYDVSIGRKAQILKLEAFIDSITASHPVVKMFNYETFSMDEGDCFTRGRRCAYLRYPYFIGNAIDLFNGQRI